MLSHSVFIKIPHFFTQKHFTYFSKNAVLYSCLIKKYIVHTTLVSFLIGCILYYLFITIVILTTITLLFKIFVNIILILLFSSIIHWISPIGFGISFLILTKREIQIFQVLSDYSYTSCTQHSYLLSIDYKVTSIMGLLNLKLIRCMLYMAALK